MTTLYHRERPTQVKYVPASVYYANLIAGTTSTNYLAAPLVSSAPMHLKQIYFSFVPQISWAFSLRFDGVRVFYGTAGLSPVQLNLIVPPNTQLVMVNYFNNSAGVIACPVYVALDLVEFSTSENFGFGRAIGYTTGGL